MFTGCVNTASRVSWLVVQLVVSHVDTVLVVHLVGAGSLGAESLETLGTGLLTAWSSAVLSVKAASVIADVMAAMTIGFVGGIGGASLLDQTIYRFECIELVVTKECNYRGAMWNGVSRNPH